jgi:hypothetical protein
MEEPIEPTAEAIELETLRKVNSELVAKHAKAKARVTELETGTATLQTKLTEANESLHQATVGVPLKALAESISTVPDLFLDQLSKHFKVELVNGSLALLSLDGKPVADKDGKPIPFEGKAIAALLTTGDDARAKTFRVITITNKSSGSAGSFGAPFHNTPSKQSTPQFGLGIDLRSK